MEGEQDDRERCREWLLAYCDKVEMLHLPNFDEKVAELRLQKRLQMTRGPLFGIDATELNEYLNYYLLRSSCPHPTAHVKGSKLIRDLPAGQQTRVHCLIQWRKF